MRQRIEVRARARALSSLLISTCLAVIVAISFSPAAPAAAPVVQTDASVVGQWAPAFNCPTVPIHISLLPDGRLLFWGATRTPTATT